MKKDLLRSGYSELNKIRYRFGIGKFSNLLSKNIALENSASDVKRCFILATGPSIKTQDLSRLQNEFCISVSNFFVHQMFSLIQPRYHVFAGTHYPITEEQVTSWWKDAEKHMEGSPKTEVLLFANDKKVVESNGLFPGRGIYYYDIGGKYPVDFKRLIPDVQTVVHIAIYLAIYIGIQEIYLLGVDHSWLLHFGKSMHFYDEKQHAFTRAHYNEWSEIKDIGEDFRSHVRLWDIYRSIRTETSKNGIRIVNASPGSLLDIFPRISFESIFNQ